MNSMLTKKLLSNKHIVIIGAGISGLSMARMLQNHCKVTVLEKGAQAGGLIQCKEVNGNLFHIVGGHVFNSKNETVLNWFWQHFNKEKEFLKAKRNAAVYLNGKHIGYPIENFIYQLADEDAKAIVNELVQLVKQNQAENRDNFRDFLLNKFGATLYNLYFGPYNNKIWNRDLSKIPLDWLAEKLPMPKINEILQSNILKHQETEMVHANFYYPVKGGSQFIINRLAEGLDIKLSYAVTKIEPTTKGLLINGGEIMADQIIYCGDIRKLNSIFATDNTGIVKATDLVKDLPANGTTNALCETDETDISWMYLPEEKYKAHRIIYTGNFSSANNAPANRKTCVVEFSGQYTEAAVKEELIHLPGNLKMLAYNYHPNSYIIHEQNTNNLVQSVKTELAPLGIHLLGRFAEWQYYNMDKCIESAMSLADKIKLMNENANTN
jgi:protoporphyrinogen oxidase